MYMNRKGLQFTSRDCYSLHDALGKINANAIRKFKETIEKRDREGLMYGLPNDVCEFNDDYSVKDWGAAKKRWFDILDKIIYALEDNEPCTLDYFEFIEGPLHGEKSDCNGVTLTRWNMVPDNNEGYEAFKKAEEEHGKKVKEGLELFAKHFLDLWY